MSALLIATHGVLQKGRHRVIRMRPNTALDRVVAPWDGRDISTHRAGHFDIRISRYRLVPTDRSARNNGRIGKPEECSPILKEHEAGRDRRVGVGVVALEVGGARGIELRESCRCKWFGRTK
jgi:hypothetical protein